MLTPGPLNDLAAVRHAFFCRTGGVSEGLFSSLNCGYGSGDEPDKVSENRRRAMAMVDLEGARLVTAYQVHSPRPEEHTSELQSLMRISYAVFCLKKKKPHQQYT